MLEFNADPQPTVAQSQHSDGLQGEVVPIAEVSFHNWRCRVENTARAFCRELQNSLLEQHQWFHRNRSIRALKDRLASTVKYIFSEGQMVVRGTTVINDHQTPEMTFQLGKNEPRPGTVIKEHLRVKLLSFQCMLGLLHPRELYCFKRDAGTSVSTNKYHSVEKMQPDLPCLIRKLGEMENNMDSLYRSITSGHWDTDGHYCSGHEKERVDRSVLPENEVVLEGYRKDDYLCVVISEPMVPESLCSRIQRKFELERMLELQELPLVFYDAQSGTIRDIIYLSDLGVFEKDLKELDCNARILRQFAENSGALSFEKLFFNLPLSNVINMLQGLPTGITEYLKQPMPIFYDELKQAVLDCDLGRVKLYSSYGADLKGIYSRGWTFYNLLDIHLLNASAANIVYAALKADPEIMQKEYRLGCFLYDNGCRISVGRGLIAISPHLAVYMLNQGECISDDNGQRPMEWELYKTFRCVLIYYGKQIIDNNDARVLLNGLQDLFPHQSEKMDGWLNEFLLKTIPDGLKNPETLTVNEIERITDMLTDYGLKVNVTELCEQPLKVLQKNVIELQDAKGKDLESLSYYLRSYRSPKEVLPDLLKKERVSRKKQTHHARAAWIKTMYQHEKEEQEKKVFLDLLYKLYLARPLAQTVLPMIIAGKPDQAKRALEQHYDGEIEAAQQRLRETGAFFLHLSDDKYQTEKSAARERYLSSFKSKPEAGKSQNETAVMFGDAAHSPFGWLKSALSKPPQTYHLAYRSLAQLAIKHYYQTPHPRQVDKLARSQNSKDFQFIKSSHGVEHVTRTQVFSEALISFFEQNDKSFEQLLASKPSLRELVPLAMVYHDVVAEVVDKSREESGAAEMFLRDMVASDRYSQDDIQLVAQALCNKESDVTTSVSTLFTSDEDSSCSQEERLLRRVLRLADRLDIVRMQDFDDSFLDLSDAQKSDPAFMAHWQAIKDGARYLAYVTGGLPSGKASDVLLERHQLNPDNNKRKLKVTRAVNAYQSVTSVLDDNVRRAILSMAGLSICQAAHSKAGLKRTGGRAACVQMTEGGAERLVAIHNEQELQQVQLPSSMTVLEKLQFETMGLDGLSPEHQSSVRSEVERLKRDGIKPPLGTLTQNTLESPAARKMLRDVYALEVQEQQRFCGYERDGDTPKYTSILSVRPVGPDRSEAIDNQG